MSWYQSASLIHRQGLTSTLPLLPFVGLLSTSQSFFFRANINRVARIVIFLLLRDLLSRATFFFHATFFFFRATFFRACLSSATQRSPHCATSFFISSSRDFLPRLPSLLRSSPKATLSVLFASYLCLRQAKFDRSPQSVVLLWILLWILPSLLPPFCLPPHRTLPYLPPAPRLTLPASHSTTPRSARATFCLPLRHVTFCLRLFAFCLHHGRFEFC